MLIFDEVPEFKKELKKLSKKWRSLPVDLSLAEKVISRLYEPQPGVSTDQLRVEFFSGSLATQLKVVENIEVVKMRLYCKDLRTDNIVRIVFIYIANHEHIQLIEMFAHNDKNREDDYRINKYLKNIGKGK